MRHYESESLQELFRSSTGERIIGTEEAKRSTKTFISSERSGIVLGLIENHARGVIRTLQKLHENRYQEKLTALEVVDRYPGAKRWVELHQELLEHFASIEGFSVQAVVSMEKARIMAENHRTESSVQGADNGRGD